MVASHKPDKVFSDDVYNPIHVGRAISKFSPSDMGGIMGDDTGKNISRKNGEYCELTAVYWAWRNMPDEVKYVGLAHYRRYFETRFTNGNIQDIFKECDVVLARPYLHDRYMEFKLARELTMEDEVILLKVLKRLFPKYEQTIIDYLYGFEDYPYNMFVMPRNVFDGYCEFLFSVLFECDKLMLPMPYTCSRRRMGYIGEFLLPIYCLHQGFHIRTEPVVSMLGEQHSDEKQHDLRQRLKIKMLKVIYDKHKPRSLDDMCMQSVLTGLKADGIKV